MSHTLTQTHNSNATAKALPRKHPTLTRCVVPAPLRYMYPLRLKKKRKKPFVNPLRSAQTHSGVKQRRRGANLKCAQQQQKSDSPVYRSKQTPAGESEIQVNERENVPEERAGSLLWSERRSVRTIGA